MQLSYGFLFFSDLEESLLLLPYAAVCEVLENLSPLLARGDHTELICKIMIFLVKLHHAPIVANHSLSLTLEKLNKLAKEHVQQIRVKIFPNSLSNLLQFFVFAGLDWIQLFWHVVYTTRD